MTDNFKEYVEKLYDKYSLPEEDISLNPEVIKLRKFLLDSAADGSKEAQLLLKKEYGMTFILHNGVEIKL